MFRVNLMQIDVHEVGLGFDSHQAGDHTVPSQLAGTSSTGIWA